MITIEKHEIELFNNKIKNYLLNNDEIYLESFINEKQKLVSQFSNIN